MGQNTTPIQPTSFFRQSVMPNAAPDGAVWQNPSDGAGNDTSSRYVYNADAGDWELDSASGPSEPTDGSVSGGALWRDTSGGATYVYDGGWVAVSASVTSEWETWSGSTADNTGTLLDVQYDGGYISDLFLEMDPPNPDTSGGSPSLSLVVDYDDASQQTVTLSDWGSTKRFTGVDEWHQTYVNTSVAAVNVTYDTAEGRNSLDYFDSITFSVGVRVEE